MQLTKAKLQETVHIGFISNSWIGFNS